MGDTIFTLFIYALPVVFAITLHEAAHAYAAKYFGDNTAYAQGRMTLNPIKHIDPVGTLLIPIVLYFVGSPFLFGYAKPVPVEFGRLRNPKKQMAFVALAGPLANLFMALLWMLIGIFLVVASVHEVFLVKMVQAGVVINLVIFAFNLFPVPPLDGGRIVSSLLPHRYAYQYEQIEPYGFFIVIALVVLKLMHYWMVPVMAFANEMLKMMVWPLTFLLGL